MELIDTNILLRWLLDDHAELSPKAQKVVEDAAPGDLLVVDIIFAELVYVLRGKGWDREQTATAITFLLETPAFRFEHEELMRDIAGMLRTYNLDFADLYLLALSRRRGYKVHTFDKALRRALRPV